MLYQLSCGVEVSLEFVGRLAQAAEHHAFASKVVSSVHISTKVLLYTSSLLLWRAENLGCLTRWTYTRNRLFAIGWSSCFSKFGFFSGNQRICWASADPSWVLRGNGDPSSEGSHSLRSARNRKDPSGQGRRQPDICHLPQSCRIRAGTNLRHPSALITKFSVACLSGTEEADSILRSSKGKSKAIIEVALLRFF